MSRLPPVPPANQSVHGPEGIAKTSVDISHRVRHQAQRAADRFDDEAQGRAAALSPNRSAWVLVAAVAALALGYVAGRQVV